MASILVVLMCAVADGFLVYVLFQFARELRAQRIARTVSAAVPVLMPATGNAAEQRHHRKVIDITSGRLTVASESELAQGSLIAIKGTGCK